MKYVVYIRHNGKWKRSIHPPKQPTNPQLLHELKTKGEVEGEYNANHSYWNRNAGSRMIPCKAQLAFPHGVQ